MTYYISLLCPETILLYYLIQVLVFVHARNETVRTAMTLRDMSKERGDSQLFLSDQDRRKFGEAQKNVSKPNHFSDQT